MNDTPATIHFPHSCFASLIIETVCVHYILLYIIETITLYLLKIYYVSLYIYIYNILYYRDCMCMYLKEMGIPDHLTCLLRNLCAGQEATVRTGYGTTDWFQIGKGVCQGCLLSL